MQNVDTYIATFPENVQLILQEVRSTIKNTAPQADESISYGLPTYKLHGKPLVYFGGFKNHIGFYATPTGHKAFAEKLAKFKQGKGSVQFRLNEPIPFDLIAEITAFRLKNAAK